tara:strand:- start:154 stop:1167 length:1014 start_codon:yes stop_codon:yes gene_type:complete
MKKRNKKLFVVFINSILMGTANKLPGVSGGLVALITGFYTEMVNSLKKLNYKTILLLFKGNFKKFDSEYNGYFLVAILFGIIVSYFTTSLILDYFFIKSELNVWSLFFGMILGSIIILLKNIKLVQKKDLFFLLLGLFFGILLSVSEPMMENKNLFFVFFCGLISVCGMIIPGISGSFLLILLGNYKLLLVDSVNNLLFYFEKYLGITNTNTVDYELINILLVFCLGSIIGLILLSKILSFLILKYYQQTNFTIIGFVMGSLFIIWPWKKVLENQEEISNSFKKINSNEDYFRYLPDLSQFDDLIALTWIFIGFIFVIYIENYGSGKTKLWFNRQKH